MISIYAILNKLNGKRYVGKSKNTRARFTQHRRLLKSRTCPRDCNRHLFNAVKKDNIENFEFIILEVFDDASEKKLKDRELFWMEYYKTTDREFGYNLRQDSSTKCFVHEETRKLQSEMRVGSNNSNYGNKWTRVQKEKMSVIAKERHASKKIYDQKWKDRLSFASKKTWENPEIKAKMVKNVSLSKRRYDFHQIDRCAGKSIFVWGSIEAIVSENPDYKWQNIYSVCNGYKPTYKGYIWRKTLKVNNAKG